MSFDMYREHILDLYRNPLNKGSIEKPTHGFEKNNPLCGDEIKMQLVITNGRICDAKFDGKGCAISMASASLLTDKIKNLDVSDAEQLDKNVILEMLGITLSPVRLKCALLSLDVLKGALGNGN